MLAYAFNKIGLTLLSMVLLIALLSTVSLIALLLTWTDQRGSEHFPISLQCFRIDSSDAIRVYLKGT
jgi:hypothetical protein